MPKPGRVSKSVTIRKDLADRLDKEADDRLVSPAFIVEKALAAFFAGLAPAMEQGAALPPKVER